MPDCPPEVYEKFVQDKDGLWYNERMELEQQKRKKFVDSRRKNLSKKTEDKEMSDAKNARKKIEGRLQQMRSPAQANIRDREDDLWRSE